MYIFNNMNIDEIVDLQMIDIPSSDDFYNFIEKDYSKVFNLYQYDNVNDFSNKFFGGAYKNTSKREIVEKEINKFTEKNNKLLLLNGPSKIGKSVTILKVLNQKKFLYIDFKYLSELDNNKKRYIYLRNFFVFLIIIMNMNIFLKNIMINLNVWMIIYFS